MTYAPEVLYQEVAYVAYYFHWSMNDILGLEHHQRQRFIAEIQQLAAISS